MSQVAAQQLRRACFVGIAHAGERGIARDADKRGFASVAGFPKPHEPFGYHFEPAKHPTQLIGYKRTERFRMRWIDDAESA